MDIRFKHKGSFSRTRNFLDRVLNKDFRSIFEEYGEKGVNALEAATPVDSGVTKNSWRYRLIRTRSGYSLNWYNINMAGRTPLVILIQYGHGTRGGAYVQGIDFINPAIKDILDAIANDIWKEVTIL